jgi:tetratricopeptide (TPR) repeat protein
MDESVLRTILITFTRTFPHALGFSSVENNDLLLIGSLGPIETDFGAIKNRMARTEVAADLERIGITSLFTLLTTQVFDESGIRQWAGIGPVNSDDFPIVEYSAPRGFFNADRVNLPTEYRLAGADNYLARYIRKYPPTADELVETANFQMVSGMTYMVFSALGDALERAPGHPEGLELMVRLLTERKKYSEAMEVLERLRTAGTEQLKILELEYPLALALAERHGASLIDPPDFSHPLEIKCALIELEPQQASHYYDLGETLSASRRWTEAAAAYEKALALGATTHDEALPEEPLVLHMIGQALLRAGEFDNAAQAYTRLLQSYPDNPLGASMLQLVAYRRLLAEQGTPDVEQLRELFSN